MAKAPFPIIPELTGLPCYRNREMIADQGAASGHPR
jgi:hypothetical protein